MPAVLDTKDLSTIQKTDNSTLLSFKKKVLFISILSIETVFLRYHNIRYEIQTFRILKHECQSKSYRYVSNMEYK
jgi:hypothetical protein